MLLDKTLQITIFKVDELHFEPVGVLSNFTSAILPLSFSGFSSFELWAPITEENSQMLVKDNIIWTGGDNAYVIEVVKSTFDNRNKYEKSYHIKGRSIEKFLCDRVIWGGYSKTGYASTIIYDIVNKNCISPSNTKRVIPWLINGSDSRVGFNIPLYQKTGGEIYDAIVSIANESGIGFFILFDPREKQMVFNVREGVDRTLENIQGNSPVVFTTDLEDVLMSTYYMNSEDVKTTALVQGEDTGEARKSVVSGLSNASGFKRKELYVDARDIQSEIYDEDGEVTYLTDEQYISSLIQRGNEKLSEYVSIETFDATIRHFGDVQYVFGVHYFIGDKVTVIDRQLGVKVSATITGVEEDYGEEYSLILTFGYSYPTLLTKVKRIMG